MKRFVNITKFRNTSILFQLILILGILFGLYWCAYFPLHNDIGYDTDVARDLLVLQNAITTHKPPLIGPRTGGIEGLFHGPLWYYISLPAFFIGHGNPVVIGWFWVFLLLVSLAVTYFVGRSIFNSTVGLLSALLLVFAYVEFSIVFFKSFWSLSAFSTVLLFFLSILTNNKNALFAFCFIGSRFNYPV